MEITNFVIGVIALVVALMALPTIFQMFFGRPYFHFEADEFTGADARILVLAIKNKPVKNRFLRAIGVEREAGDITASFGVQELGTGKIIADSIAGQLNCTPLLTVGLQARALPNATVGLTVILTRNGVAHIVDARPEKEIPISTGRYIARIAITRGQDTYGINQTFRVSSVDHETIWDQRNVISTRR